VVKSTSRNVNKFWARNREPQAIGGRGSIADAKNAMRAGFQGDQSERSIFLVGFMGAGKTSVGRALSRRLQWPFEDLDDRIAAKAGRSIEEIFRTSGEAVFRQIETEALRELAVELRSGARIVALGGGTFTLPENVSIIRELETHTVFLDAPVEELLRRCREEVHVRPLCQSEEQFRRLYEARRPAYMAAACRIETDNKEAEIVAAEVACSLGVE
jgi:shikimate kinase